MEDGKEQVGNKIGSKLVLRTAKFRSLRSLNSPHHSASRDGTGDDFLSFKPRMAQSELLTTSKLE